MYSPLSAASLSSIVDVVVHDARLLCIGNFYVSCWDGFPSMPSASYIGKQLKQWSVGTVAVGLLTKSCCFISIRNVDGVLGKWYHTGIINFPHPATSAAFNYGDFWVQDSRPIGRCEIKRRGDCGNNDMGEGETLCDTTKATTINITTTLHPPIHPGWQQHHDCLATATQSQQQMRTTTWLLAPNFGNDLVKENEVTFNHNQVCWCKRSSWVPFKALHDAQKSALVLACSRNTPKTKNAANCLKNLSLVSHHAYDMPRILLSYKLLYHFVFKLLSIVLFICSIPLLVPCMHNVSQDK